MKIQSIIEGHGETSAVPVLLRRFVEESGLHDLEIGKPIRRPRTQLTAEAPLKQAVRLASIQPGCGGILILFDADDDCPAALAPKIQAWARAEASHLPSAVVLACREYEAWFLAALDSLRGQRSVRRDVTLLEGVETIRDAKGRLSDSMEAGTTYSETVDQAAMTRIFDLRAAYRACRSFRKMAKAFGDLARAMSFETETWPPRPWIE